MKCPKCNYTNFDNARQCKKCTFLFIKTSDGKKYMDLQERENNEIWNQALNQTGALFPSKGKFAKQDKDEAKVKPVKKEKIKKEKPAKKGKSSLINFLKSDTIALDIGSNSIKAIKAQMMGNSLKILNYSLTPLPPVPNGKDQGLSINDKVPIISRILTDLNIRKGKYVIAVGGPSVVVRQIKFPRLSEKQLKDSLKWEAKSYVPFPLEEVEIYSQILDPKKNDKTMKVLLVAVKKNLLNRIRESLMQIGLEPDITDINCLAIMNTFFLNEHYEPNETIVLIDIGAQITTLNIYREQGLFFTRDIPIAGNRLTREIETKLNINYQKAEELKKKKGNTDNEIFNIVQPVLETLIREIRRSLTYYENQSEVKGFSRVLLTGGGSNISGITKYFSEELQLPVTILNSLANVSVDQEKVSLEALKEIKSQLALAIGLACRG